jgi:hypothetical protein
MGSISSFFFVLQFAPVSGKVVAINEGLGGQPSLLNKSPEDEGTAHSVFSFLFTSAYSGHYHRLALPTQGD